MRKLLIFGNSGSGKSTIASKICQLEKLAHLDLDTLAWQPSTPPNRKLLSESFSDISQFINAHESWVIEGCYSDLLELTLPFTNEIIFMNLPIEVCIENAKNRPWEPHKYASKIEQDANLVMLIQWIKQYETRNDIFSKSAHEALFQKFSGKKTIITRNFEMMPIKSDD